MYQTITAYRALGILQLFLVQHQSAIQTWLLPATVCFSVPFLFVKMQKNIIFYDMGASVDELAALCVMNHYKPAQIGVLVVEPYGKALAKDTIRQLTSQYACVIQDSCLSIPDLNLPTATAADLIVYSTGKGKNLEIGQGAVAHLKEKYIITFSNLKADQKENIANNYAQADEYWKNIITTNSNVDRSFMENLTNIDTSSQVGKFTEQSYIAQIKLLQPKIITHKAVLNQIYQTIIPEALQCTTPLHNWRFTLFVDKPEVVSKAIFGIEGLFASRHYANVANYIKTNHKNNTFVVANFIQSHIINLFNDFYYNASKAEQTAELIKNLYQSNIIKPVDIPHKINL